MSRRVRSLAATCLVCAWVLGAWAAEGEGLEERIRQAEHLNLHAPWQESQAVLDELAPALARATPEQRARISFLQARNLALAGNYEEALANLDPLYRRDLSPDVKLKVFRLAANITLQQDEFEDSYRYLLRGLQLLPKATDPRPKTNLLALLAYFYGVAGEAELSIDYGRRALETARASGSLRDICIAHHDLSVAQERAGRMEEALEQRRLALDYCRRAGDPVHEGVSMVTLVQLQFQTDAEPGAVERIREGMAKLREAGYRDGVLDARLTLAEVLMELYRWEEAEALLQPLVEEFEHIGLWRSLSDTHALLARIAEERGEFERALRHFRAADAAGEQLMDRERAMRVAYLQVELDARQKEQQIELLREQNRVLELRDETQRQRRYLAFGGVGATSVIGLLLFILLMRSRSDRRYLLWLSEHDGLTGLRNHNSFFRRANDALKACRKLDQPFTLIVADIDYFKAINDEHGHITGDAVLGHVGALFRSVFEPAGIVGRIGGEEFAMALPGIGRERAREMIEEFNSRLKPVRQNGTAISITLSYGLAETQHEKSVELLRHYADAALYEAKRRGRNCIVDAAEIIGDPAIQIPMNRRADDLT